MNNKPHTEREDVIEYFSKQKKKSKRSTNPYISTEYGEGVSDTCDKIIEYMENSKPPKGKTAVTFYIPEGMRAGTAIMRAFDKGSVLVPIIEEGSTEEPDTFYSCIDIQAIMAWQIQEAIDNTFPETK